MTIGKRIEDTMNFMMEISDYIADQKRRNKRNLVMRLTCIVPCLMLISI